MSHAGRPVYDANPEEVDAARARQAREDLTLRYFLVPLFVVLTTFILAVAFRLLGAGEALLEWTIIIFSALMLGTMAMFWAHRAARALHSAVKLAWYGYAIVVWVSGCALLVTFVTSLALYKIH